MNEIIKESPLFSEKLLSNQEWLPSENDKEMMGKSYQEAVDDYNKAEQEVIFTNLDVLYDTCDCGDGYGCSHGSFPYQITVIDDKSAEITYEDDGLCFSKDRKFITIGQLEGFTISDFVRCCELVGIELKYKEQPF